MHLNFDATQVDPTNQYDVIPAGTYEVMITESERKFTKAGTGAYLELTLEIQSGEHQGRKLFDRLNLENQNRTAVDIAQRTLSQICHAVNVLQVTDSSQLHHRPMLAKVKVRPPREQYEASNEIGGYAALSSTPAPAPTRPVPPQARPPAPAPVAPPPWAAR